MNNQILYSVVGKEVLIENERIKLLNKTLTKPTPFFNIHKEILNRFAAIHSNNDIINFINNYGNIKGSEEHTTSYFKEQSEIYSILLKLIDIVTNNEETDIMLQNIKLINLEKVNNHIKKYMSDNGNLKEYETNNYWKDIKYKSGIAIKELNYIIQSNYSIENDNGTDYIFISNVGEPIYKIIENIYYIIHNLFSIVLNDISLEIYFDIDKHQLGNYIRVNSLLEAIYLVTFNSLETDMPIRNCHNHNCYNVIISTNKNKFYCSDLCRSNANKKKISSNPIKKLTNAYKQKVYRLYNSNKIDSTTQEKFYKIFNNKEKEFMNKNIKNIEAYKKEYDKIIDLLKSAYV